MTFPLAEVEAELADQRKEGETIARLHAGGLSVETSRLLLDQLSGIRSARAERAAKFAPPPPPPVLKDVGSLSPATAAEKAAAIRARPEYWKPNLRDKDGQLVITAEAHANLVREHGELLARAAAETE